MDTIAFVDNCGTLRCLACATEPEHRAHEYDLDTAEGFPCDACGCVFARQELPDGPPLPIGTCIEHGPGGVLRLSYQVTVF